MGEKNNAEMTLYYSHGGMFEKIETITEIPTLKTFVDGKRDAPLDLSDMSFTVTLKIPKHFRCKSRKRFIKLLMSKGMRRDYDVLNANMMRESGLSYSDAWFRLMIFGGF